MAPDVYTISFVLEKIHRTFPRDFALSLRFEGHDWCSVGHFDDGDLPIGFVFTTILSSFNNADKFNVEINVSNKSSFLACLQFPKTKGADILFSRGFSVLYPTDENDAILAVTIAVKIAKYYGSPPLDNVLPLRESGTQTERIEMRTAETQVLRHYNTTGSNTELHILSAAELESAVTNAVAQHLSSKENKEAKAKQETAVEKTPTAIVQPIPAVRKHDDLRLGKNLVPRLQKLRVLDKMIDERTALVDQFDTSLFKMELALKREFIKKSRMELVNVPRADAAKQVKTGVLSKLKTTPQREEPERVTSSEKLPPEEVPEQRSSSQSSAESNSSTSASETEDEDESTTESSTTASSSSTSSSRETVLRRNSASPPSLHKTSDQTRQTTTVSPPPPVERTTQHSLSPTSLYLKQLREKILQERLHKI
ncbi:hypothetical protein Y032_0135g1902 [Ancylostoma ceylanicum]|uniref:Uncharacterized protein n=1 Tax=Ancylostoma ceylanicum TaxID=53326 RepID=A0A016T5M6_9BILA|nr:hypothetical protein Y032_0135g1902 [Ancylostoma ceylanicum]